MNKDGSLTISNWNKGQEPHPIYGFGVLKNVEVFENKGLVKIKNRSLNREGVLPFTPTALPIAEVYDNYGNTYTLTGVTDTGSFYKNGVSVQGSLTNARDIALYQDYVWIRHGESLSCFGPVNDSPAWFADIETGLANNYNGKILVGQDSFLYVTNGNNIKKYTPNTIGTAGVAPTLTTSTTLSLPDGQYATTIEEFGTLLMIGTQGGPTYESRGNYANARLYPWNRQAGTLGNPGLADLPIILTDNGVNAIKQHANRLYVSAGTRGNLYVTDSTNYQQLPSLPYSKVGSNYQANVYSNALSISSRGTLLVGLSGEEADTTNMGVYEMDISDSKYPIQMFTTASVSNGDYKIGFIEQKDYQTRNIGWSNLGFFDVDTSDDKLYGSYRAVIESPLEKVGSFNKKKTFEFLEFSLAEPLVEGQALRFSFRTDSSSNYTLIDTYSFDTLGSVISHEAIVGIADAEYVQIKIELSQESTTPITNNIYLVSVDLR